MSLLEAMRGRRTRTVSQSGFLARASHLAVPLVGPSPTGTARRS
ncbi:hypothetical protein [Schaalia hyovaginalis]|uniref:Uncharacterized protein n=1 Tax=Schaalia hyovaginalis TaxID=29316 RepID=A0A923E374_9ACTO|nr:hypothetical protein [Schaalia hyovaginalis]MBB6333552.1 hypothetical protein [Schaalia hyovaginalis]